MKDNLKPSTILKFPRPPLAHQSEEGDLSAELDARALLWECGTGKSFGATIWMRWKYYKHDDVLPTLIITPVATLYNWLDEFKLNAPARIAEAATVVYGAGKKRITQLEEPGKKIFVTNYETLDMPAVVEAIAKKKFSIIVCDEMHRLKNYKSKRLKALLSFSDSATYRMGLTGTPILNNYLDLWAQWRFLDGGKEFNKSFFIFRETYFVDKNRGMPKSVYFPNYVPKPNIEAELSEKIGKIASRKTKDECLDLPPLIETVRYVEMGVEQARAYEQMKKELVTYIKDDACTASNALVKVGRLIQIASGYVQLETGVAHQLKDNPRLSVLEELFEELCPRHKVIVWCIYKENYKQIIALCEKLGIKYAQIHGGIDDKHGQKNYFQDNEECRVMIANPESGGEGITLTKSCYTIYYSRGYSRKQREQSLSRNHRRGSEIHDKITAIDLVAKGTIEEQVLDALRQKQEFSDNVLDRLRGLFK